MADIENGDPQKRLEAEATMHPPTAECPDPECVLCGVRDCPYSDPLHYHHDGCPSCDRA